MLPPTVAQLLQLPGEEDEGRLVGDYAMGTTINAGSLQYSQNSETEATSRKRPSARGTTFYPRKRANTACQVCRARKTKCDNSRPSCSYCVSVGANCIQSPQDLSSFDPASLKILDRLDDLERQLDKAVQAFGGSDKAPRATPSAAALTSSTWIRRDLDHTWSAATGPASMSVQEPCLARLDARSPNPPTVDATSSSAENAFRIGGVLPQRVELILEWPTWRRRGGDQIEHPPHVPRRSSMLSNRGQGSLIGLFELNQGQAYRLLDNFFAHVHGKNPVLDEPTTRRLFKETLLIGIDWSPASCLTLIICALGSLATPFGSSGSTKLGTQAYADSQCFFEASQKRIGSLLTRDDLVGAQCLFLSGVYMMQVFQPTHAWRFFLQALAACQDLPSVIGARQTASVAGTPQSPSATSDAGNQDSLEQALYWSAWKSERELRYELSFPDFEIQVSGNNSSTLYPPFFPTPPIPPAPTVSSLDGSNEPEARTNQARAAWLFYLAEISLIRLTSRICSEMLALTKLVSHDSEFLGALEDVIPEYAAQIQQWCDSLPNELSLSSSAMNDDANQYVLRGKMLNLFEIMYWPFVVASITFSETDRAKMSTTVQRLATRGLETHITQIRINESGFEHRHHGCFFMIRSCTRSALVLLAAAKAGCTMPASWDDFIHRVTRMLSFWKDEDKKLVGWKCTIEHELATLAEEDGLS